MGEIKLQINPKNRPAVPAVNWQQARVLEMQEEYAAAFDTSLVNTIEEMRAAYNEERKMWNTGGPVMAETVDFDVPYEGDKGTGTFTSSSVKQRNFRLSSLCTVVDL